MEVILTRLPHFYDKSEVSNMYQILKAFADEFDIFVDKYIVRADDDLGIMSTDARDLDWRWGHMLGFPRYNGEKDESYRLRLVNMINALRGGTAPSIQYAVALAMGIADDVDETNKRIHVYDAWEYPDLQEHLKIYGNFVVEIVLDSGEMSTKYPSGIVSDDIADIIHVTKAAGTFCTLYIGIALRDEHIIIDISTGYVKYHHRRTGTYPRRSRRGKIDNLDIIIKTHNDGLGYRNPFTGEIVSGVFPVTSTHGKVSTGNIEINAGGHGIDYFMPYTGEVNSGTYPRHYRVGAIVNGDLVVLSGRGDTKYRLPETGTRPHTARVGAPLQENMVVISESGEIMYINPATGTKPQSAEIGAPVDGDIAIMTNAGNTEYKSTASGTQPTASESTAIINGKVVVMTTIGKADYTNPSTGQSKSGESPDMPTQSSLDTSVTGDGNSYRTRMCGSTLGNIF